MHFKTKNLITIIIGAFIYAMGFQFFIYPNAIIPGGVTGISVILNRFTNLPIGTTAFVLNIPIFIVAWRRIGGQFIFGSVIGMAVSNFAIDLLSLTGFSATHNPLLGAIFGGITVGLGLGLVFSTGASTGGVDVVATLLRLKYEYMNLGHLVLILDAVIIFSGAVVFRSFDSAMYAIIGVFISSKVMDGVLYGFFFSKVCFIVSDESEQISHAITETLDRGVTFIYGRGAYSGKDKSIIMCAIKRQQIVSLKNIVYSIDSTAFMIVTEAREILGSGFTVGGSK